MRMLAAASVALTLAASPLALAQTTPAPGGTGYWLDVVPSHWLGGCDARLDLRLEPGGLRAVRSALT